VTVNTGDDESGPSRSLIRPDREGLCRLWPADDAAWRLSLRFRSRDDAITARDELVNCSGNLAG